MNRNPHLRLKDSWETVQLKRLFDVIAGATPQSSVDEYWGGEIPWATPSDVSSMPGMTLRETERTLTREGYESCGAKVALAGSIVFTKRAPIGNLAVLGIDACTNQGCLLLEPTQEVNTRFYYHILRIQTGYLNGLGSGSTFMELGSRDLKDLVVPYPPLPEQNAIVENLGDETSEIDRLIESKRQLLRWLDQKRRAVVARAVTQGLDAGAPTCESEYPWLGEIPSHWETMHLKRVLEQSDYGTSQRTSSEGNIAVLRMGDINDGAIAFDDLAYLDEVDDELLLQPGDLLFNRTNSLEQVGKAGLFGGYGDGPVSFASYLVRLRCKDRVVPAFLNHLLNSPAVLAWARGVAIPAIGQANLSPRRYGYLPIALPPLDEQRAIVKHIRAETGKIDRVREGTQATIGLLEERRSALVTAAVTGQLHDEVPV